MPDGFHATLLSTDDTALSVAVEHVSWCRSRGDKPVDILASIDLISPTHKPTWDDAVWAVASEWQRIAG